ncbi:MAG: hypothetical protein ACYCW6_23895 [Candidatus Xenobia bacterium]
MATIVLTTLMAVTAGSGWTRMNLPLVLGTLATSERERAMLIGVGFNLVMGWAFSVLYAAIFMALHHAGMLLGAVLGGLHGLFVVAVMLPLLPSVHPRMASEYAGPTPHRRLEPPGFMGLNYGRWTPLCIIGAHVVYGAVLGFLL